MINPQWNTVLWWGCSSLRNYSLNKHPTLLSLTDLFFVRFIFQGPVAWVAQQSERTSSGLWSRGHPGLLQSSSQRDQDMSQCRGGSWGLGMIYLWCCTNPEYSPPTSKLVKLPPVPPHCRMLEKKKRDYSIVFTGLSPSFKSETRGPEHSKPGRWPRLASLNHLCRFGFDSFRAAACAHFFVSDLADCQQHLCTPCCVCYASHSSSQKKNANRGELWQRAFWWEDEKRRPHLTSNWGKTLRWNKWTAKLNLYQEPTSLFVQILPKICQEKERSPISNSRSRGKHSSCPDDRRKWTEKHQETDFQLPDIWLQRKVKRREWMLKSQDDGICATTRNKAASQRETRNPAQPLDDGMSSRWRFLGEKNLFAPEKVASPETVQSRKRHSVFLWFILRQLSTNQSRVNWTELLRWNEIPQRHFLVKSTFQHGAEQLDPAVTRI